jgi:preprotein translocase subunit YajC
VPELASLLPLVGIALLFWFLMIRPTQRRQREMRSMQSSLAVGAEVMLTSGIYGVVRSVVDDRVGIEVAPGVTIETARGAVASIVAPVDDQVSDDVPDDETDADDTDSDPASTGEER